MRLSNLVNVLNPAAPKGVIPSAHDWVARWTDRTPRFRQPQPHAWVKDIFPPEDSINLLRYPLEPTPGEEFTSVRWTANEPARLFYLRDCRVLGSEGAVISPDNRIFADFTLPPANRWQEHSCFKRRRIPAVTPLKGWYATVTWPESRFFYHWMVEALPRMAVLGDYATVLDGLFVPGPLQNYHRDSLRELGIAEDKLIPLDVNSHFQPEHLFVPHTFAMYNPPRWIHRWFKRTYLPQPGHRAPAKDHGKRIYVSRADAPARRIGNEQDVTRMLDRLGFTTVRLSEHPFAEQARIFNQAEVIVGGHGAGLANIVFCRERTIVIDVLPPRWMAPCFMTLASSAQCRYHHLVGLEAGGPHAPDPQRDDICIPIDELERLLDVVLQQ